MATGIYRPNFKDRHGKTRRCKTWWVRFSVNGKTYRESSGSELQRDAIALRATRLAEAGQGIDRPAMAKTTVMELFEILRAHYRDEGLKSADRLETSLKHLIKAFGSWMAINITPPVVAKYKSDRLAAGAARGTIQHELMMLNRAFVLGEEQGMVASVPRIKKFGKLANVRKGFFDLDDIARLLQELPERHAAWALFGFLTAWRVRSEIWPLTWANIDFRGGWIRIEDSKNGRPREFPINGPLRELLTRQRERVTQLEKELNTLIRFVFPTEEGTRIKSAVTAWRSACKRSGCQGRIIHDLRRSGAREMRRKGLGETLIMKLAGWRSHTMFDRYSITDSQMLREAGEMLETDVEMKAKKLVLNLKQHDLAKTGT